MPLINDGLTKEFGHSAEYDKSIKVMHRDQGNIVNTNSWKPLFCKINMVRHANVMK